MAAIAKTRILREEWEVEPRLADLQLDRAKLLEIRSTAVAAASDATPFHPANAAGTLSYQHGTFALRREHVGETWHLDRPNGVEAIRNEAIRVKVVFANVDIACNDEHEPKPRFGKGAGAEKLCAGNLFESLPRYTRIHASEEGWTIYYLMVAPDGAVELSCPVVKNKTFQEYIERLYLSNGSDIGSEAELLLEELDISDNFDPKVARK